MDNNLKNDIFHVFLPIIHIMLICGVIIFILFTRELNSRALDKADELEKRIEANEKMIDFLITADQNKFMPDTIIININTQKK